MNTLNNIALMFAVAAPLIGGAGFVGKLYGDTIWVPVGAYQQEKLYDLQDEFDDLEAKEQYEGPLTQREKEQQKRLLRRIERLELELQ